MDIQRPNRANRVSVSRECVMVDEFGEERPAIITDISKSGFRMKASDCPSPGHLIRLLVDGYEFECQVAWARFGEVGGIFLDHVELDEVGNVTMNKDDVPNPDRRISERRSGRDRRQNSRSPDGLGHSDHRQADRGIDRRRSDG